MREQDVRARYIDCQYSPQRIPETLVPLASQGDGAVYEPAFACDTQGVEYEESVVSEPRPELRDTKTG